MSSTITALTSGGGLAMAGDTSGQLELKTNNGTTAVTVDTSQNVGIGSATLSGYGSNTNKLYQKATGTNPAQIISQASTNDSACTIGHNGTAAVVSSTYGTTGSYTALAFNTSDTEQMRITPAGALCVGTTATIYSAKQVNAFNGVTTNGLVFNEINNTAGTTYVAFLAAGTVIGAIDRIGGTNAIAYGSASDYRLKENIVPMSSALDKVSRLKPVTYKWKATDENGEGFIAHELAEVCPDAVIGTKDKTEIYTDEDGNEQIRPKYQYVDTSFLVATLTAAIQELNAKVDAQALEIQELKGVA